MRRALIVVSLAALALLSAESILRITAIMSSRPMGLLWPWPWDALLYALFDTLNVLVPAPAIVALVHAAQHRRWPRIIPLLVALTLATYSPTLAIVGEVLLRLAPSDTQSYYILFWVSSACQPLPALMALAYARYGFGPPSAPDLEVSSLLASRPPSPFH